jgi:hypothetical protein
MIRSRSLLSLTFSSKTSSSKKSIAIQVNSRASGFPENTASTPRAVSTRLADQEDQSASGARATSVKMQANTSVISATAKGQENRSTSRIGQLVTRSPGVQENTSKVWGRLKPAIKINGQATSAPATAISQWYPKAGLARRITSMTRGASTRNPIER